MIIYVSLYILNANFSHLREPVFGCIIVRDSHNFTLNILFALTITNDLLVQFKNIVTGLRVRPRSLCV